MKQSKGNPYQKIGFGLVVLILCGAFIRLGIWQLDRAADFKELQKPYVEQPVIQIAQSIASLPSLVVMLRSLMHPDRLIARKNLPPGW